jgi:hypothetical protein
MHYNLKVYDNYHYADESEAYNHGWHNNLQET